MTKEEIFVLYKDVQKKDKGAENRLIAEHRRVYPDNWLNKTERGECSEYRDNLHAMYLHLTR